MKCSNLDIMTVTDGSRPVVGINLLHPESFCVVRAEHVVQDRIHVNDDIVLLGGFYQFEKLVLGSVLCTNLALLVELAEVILVVNVITDALPPNDRSDTSRTENRFTGIPHHWRPLSELW